MAHGGGGGYSRIPASGVALLSEEGGVQDVTAEHTLVPEGNVAGRQAGRLRPRRSQQLQLLPQPQVWMEDGGKAAGVSVVAEELLAALVLEEIQLTSEQAIASPGGIEGGWKREAGLRDPTAHDGAAAAGTHPAWMFPAPPRHHKNHLRLVQVLYIASTWWGLSLWLYMFTLLMVPIQISAMVGVNSAGTSLGMVTSVAAVVSTIGSPIFGAISDNGSTKWGRRNPYMIGGIALSFLCGYFLLVRSMFLYTVAFAATNLFLAMASAAFNGLVADSVSEEQRGMVSGVVGAMGALGLLCGASIGFGYDSLGDLGCYFLVYGLLIASCVITVMFAPSNDLSKPIVRLMAPKTKISLSEFAQPFYSSDFRWVFITRLLVQMGIFTVQEFLLYYLKYAIELPEGMAAETALSISMIPLLLCALASPIIAGYLSDWLGGRRKILVYVAGSIKILVCIVMAFNRTWAVVPVLAGIFGLGYGAFNAIDFAMALDVLPSEEHTARDLGVWNLALIIPLCCAAPVAGVFLDMFNKMAHNAGYTFLFSLAAVYLIAGIVAIQKVKGVK